jgi:hypothetical protein
MAPAGSGAHEPLPNTSISVAESNGHTIVVHVGDWRLRRRRSSSWW